MLPSGTGARCHAPAVPARSSPSSLAAWHPPRQQLISSQLRVIYFWSTGTGRLTDPTQGFYQQYAVMETNPFRLIQQNAQTHNIKIKNNTCGHFHRGALQQTERDPGARTQRRSVCLLRWNALKPLRNQQTTHFHLVMYSAV